MLPISSFDLVKVDKVAAPQTSLAGRSATERIAELWERSLATYVWPVSRRLAERPKWEILAVSVLLTALIAVGEYFIRIRMSVALFYIPPIAMTAWFAGRRGALALMVVSIPIWLTAVWMKGERDYLAPLIINRLALLYLLGLVIAHIRDLQQNLQVIAERRAKALVTEIAERERLEREMLDISEREQQRIGQELHDGLCQQLAGTAMVTHVLARRLANSEEGAEARKIVSSVEQAIDLARSVAKGLYPVATQSDGLMQAFEEFSATTSDIFGVSCRFDCDLPVLVEPPATAAHLFRIAQEAVSNAIRHGRATDILISLHHTESGLKLSVSDNGRGFDTTAPPKVSGMGLRTMAIRAKLMSGQLHVGSKAAGGMEVNCLIPEPLDRQ
jgi:signal transduction histidine kinase